MRVERFLMIHGLGRGAPVQKYDDNDDGRRKCQAECERLARQNPGTAFVIMKASGGCFVPKMAPERVEIIDPRPF